MHASWATKFSHNGHTGVSFLVILPNLASKCPSITSSSQNPPPKQKPAGGGVGLSLLSAETAPNVWPQLRFRGGPALSLEPDSLDLGATKACEAQLRQARSRADGFTGSREARMGCVGGLASFRNLRHQFQVLKADPPSKLYCIRWLGRKVGC